MNDDLNVILKAQLDVNQTAKEINIQLGQLEDKIQSLGIDINLDGVFKSFNTSFNKVKESVDAIQKSYGKIGSDNKFTESFNKLNSRVKDIRENVDALAKVKIGLDSSGNIQNALITYKNELGQVVNSTMAWKDELNEIGEPTGIKVFEKVWENITDDIETANKQLDKQKSLYKEIKTILDKLPSSAVGTTNTQELYSLLDSTTEIKDLQALKDVSAQYYNESIANEKELNNAQKSRQQSIKETFNDYKKIQDISTKVDKGLADLNSIKTSYTGANVQDFERIERAWKNIRNQVENGNMDFQEANNEIKKLINSTKDFETASKKASTATNSLGDRLKKAFQYFTFYDALQLSKRAVENMVEVIFDLDDALVELRKVSDLTGSSLENFSRQAYALGSEISKSGSEVIRASTEFARAGYADEELMSLAESALKLTSIGDGITDVSESANTIIAVLRGFNKETSETTKILDTINNVSNNASVSFDQIAMALTRMSGTMNATNVSMEESIGMFTAINEVLRNAEMSSTALNSISMRLRGLEEDGTAIDGLVPKLKGMFKDIAGIDITDSMGQVESLYQIAEKLAPVWDTLTTNQKTYISTEAAGLRQSKAFLIMMDNFDRVLETTSLAYNSAGSSAQEFARWQESIEGRTNELKSAIEQFASETIDSGFTKSVISATTELIKFGTAVGGAVPVVTSLGLSFLAFQKGSMVNTLFASAITQIKILTTTTIGAVSAVTALQMALGVGFVVAGILGVSYAINKASEKANEAKEAVNKLSNELSDMKENSKSVDQLGKRFEELREKSTLSNTEQQEFLNIQNQLRELLPEVNGYYDVQGNYIIDEKESLYSLNKEYREYIALKKQELADASKESSKYTIADYETETRRIELLKQYLEYAKKEINGTLETSDLDQINILQNYLGLDFDKSTIDKAIKNSQSEIKQLISTMQSDIRNQITNTNEWNNLAEDTQNAILKAFSEVSEYSLVGLSEGIVEGDISARNFIDTLSNTDAFKDFKKQLDEAKNSTEVLGDKIIELSDTLSDFSNKQDIFKSINDEISENNQLSLDSIQELLKTYPQLEQVLSDYLSGLASTTDVLDELNIAYEADVANYKDAVISKQSTNEEFYSNTANLGGKLVKAFSESYDIDLSNCKNLAEAKIKVEQETVKSIATLWNKYYDSQKQDFNSAFYNKMPQEYDTRSAKELTNTLFAYKGLLDERTNRLNEIVYEGIAVPPTSVLKNSNDPWVKAFQKQYDELKYLRDKDLISAQQYYNGLKSLNDKYFAGNSKYIDQFRQYDLELYNLQKELAEKHIENVVKSYEKANKEIERSITQLDLQQQLVNDNSQEYIDIEQKKYNEIVKLETELQRTISELQAIGTEESKKQAEDYIDTYYDTVSQRNSIIANLQSSQISIFENQIDDLEKQKSTLEDLHDFTMQMIKDELNAKKKSIQEEIKGIEEVFNRRKQALRDEQDTRNYNKGLTEKSSVVADLENQLALIKNDETAIAKRKQLEQDLVKAKEDLADYQYDHSIELAEKALDEELEIQKSKLEEEIEELDDTLSNEVTMRELANKRIEKSGEKLKNQLIKHAKEYGTFTEEEVTNAWDIAGEAVDDFNLKQLDLLDTLKLVSEELIKTKERLEEIENLSTGEYGSKIGAGTGTVNREQSITKMQSNSERWVNADSQEKQRLAEENQKLGKALGLTYDEKLGAWFYDKQKKLRVYHNGGIVGGYSTKSTEELALLAKKELVITPPQAQNIMDNITNNSNSNITLSMPVYIEGNADSDTVKAIEKQIDKLADTVIGKLNQARVNTGFKKKPKFV